MSPQVRVANWTRVIDELEEELEAVEAALEAGDAVPGAMWVPPQGLGPPPQQLHGRLRALALRLSAVQERTRVRLEELTEELTTLDRRRQAEAAYGGSRRSA